jgi:hypothetical protein
MEEEAEGEVRKVSGWRWQGTGDRGGARSHHVAPAAACRAHVGGARDVGEDPKQDVVGQSDLSPLSIWVYLCIMISLEEKISNPW